MAQVTAKHTVLPTAAIGPQSWRNDTLKSIKLNQSIVQRSDKSCEQGKSLDPLPHLRETVAELSNDVAHKYFREVRAVVFVLRESLLETNEEIKSLTNGKEALEKALDHIRKDLNLNQESHDIRQTRPSREKPHDGVDDMLSAERMQLLNMKKHLEGQLKLVQQQLLVLDRSRKRLAAVVQERAHVLDLVCHALPSLNAGSGLFSSAQPVRQSFSGTCGTTDDCPRPSVSSHGRLGGVTVDPLGAFTPEAKAALQEAKAARHRSGLLRAGLRKAITNAARTQTAAHKSVNDGLTQKVAETVQLKQNLQMAAGQNRHAINRAQRWYEATEKAWGNSLGPLASSDLGNRERLDRPVIRCFQRHPGTNLPEAQEIVKGGDGLLDSLANTTQNIGLLKLARLKLKDDILDKSSAIDTDGSVIRLRRRKASHRWNMGEAF